MKPRAETAPLGGRNVLVLGLGRHDGGVETVRFLAKEGARVLVSDTAKPEALSASVAAIEGTGATLHFGPQTVDLLERAGKDPLVVASPAIPFDHAVLAEAERRGIPTTTEVSLFAARVRAPVLAVTGTKGKSTTTTLLANMVAATGVKTHMGGNVGRPLVGRLDAIEPEDAVVLELSSFQLAWLSRIGFRPKVAVVLNLFPDHLDRHGTMEDYALSKRAILDAQRTSDVAVLPARDETLARFGFYAAGAARRVLFGAETPGKGIRVTPQGDLADGAGRTGTALDGFRLWGRHNRVNAAAAAAAALAFGATWAEVRAGALATRTLRHRLEPVALARDVLFVDDSIATTPQSAAAALSAVPRPCVILVGGKSKARDGEEIDPAPLLDAIAKRARAVVGIGTTGPDLVAAISQRGGPPAVVGGQDLRSAVSVAMQYAKAGDAVLLSPGYSSLDHFTGFEARGDSFADAARALPGAVAATA